MKSSHNQHHLLSTLLACSCVVLTACAGFSADGGFRPVAEAARAQLGKEARWPRTDEERGKRDAAVAALLANPLDVEDAVQIALLNNPGLQASFQDLGISEADLVQSGRLPNPRFTLRHAGADGVYNIEQTLIFNIAALLTVPFVHAAEQRRFGQAQDAAVIQLVQLADRTRTAYYTALAARELLQHAGRVQDAAQTGAELAQRMQSAGSWTPLQRAHEQAFYWQAMQDLSRAQLAEETARAELVQLLGIADARADMRLAEHLPDLPRVLVDLPDAEAKALQQRFDLQLMRAELDELARRLRLTKATRFVNVLDLGPARVLEGTRQQPYLEGYEVSLEIPIFDTGAARVRRAEALYARAAERFAQAAIEARTEVVKASAGYRQAFVLAVRQRDDVMPVHELVVKQNLLRYNASLVSVFDLLSDARTQIAGVDAYIIFVRDFWIAKSHLDAALIANPPP